MPKPFFAALNNEDKKAALTKAIEDIKDASNFIEGNNETMKMQTRDMKRFEVDWYKETDTSFRLPDLFLHRCTSRCNNKEGRTRNTGSYFDILFCSLVCYFDYCRKNVEEGLVSGIAGMWASSYILLPIGYS